MTLAGKLSEYAKSLDFKDIDQETIVEAKKRILDTLGCAIGSFREKPIKETMKVVTKHYSSKACSVFGTRKKTTYDMATFTNGAMIRYFDFNDTYLSKEPAHPSDNIAACLAMAELQHLSGKELLLSIILSYEIQCRLCDAASIRARGWDHVCYGLVSSALSAGRLLNLRTAELENAVNIALNSHIAMRQVRVGELSDWKGFSFANAARNAVFSVVLAKAGITGPSPIFEGEMGFFRQVSGDFDLEIDNFGGRGKPFKLAETYIKFFPAEYHAQTAVSAALEIRKEIPKDSKIESVDIETHEAGYNILGKDKEKWTPRTKETADHSLPYMVAVALIDGKLDNASYSKRKLSDPRIVELLPKIIVREVEEFTKEYPHKIANRITVKLSSGQKITNQSDLPKGHPANPMTQEEIREKFEMLTSGMLVSSQVGKIFEFVWNIEKQRDVSRLFDLCVVRSRA